jgi:hypothetical protein
VTAAVNGVVARASRSSGPLPLGSGRPARGQVLEVHQIGHDTVGAVTLPAAPLCALPAPPLKLTPPPGYVTP